MSQYIGIADNINRRTNPDTSEEQRDHVTGPAYATLRRRVAGKITGVHPHRRAELQTKWHGSAAKMATGRTRLVGVAFEFTTRPTHPQRNRSSEIDGQYLYRLRERVGNLLGRTRDGGQGLIYRSIGFTNHVAHPALAADHNFPNLLSSGQLGTTH